jgi:hypothetical protein
MADPVNFSDLSALLGADVDPTDKVLIQHLDGGEPAPDKFFTIELGELSEAIAALIEPTLKRFEYKTAAFTAVSLKQYIVKASASLDITLPATPTVGDSVVITDFSNTFGSHTVTVLRNGNLIESQGDDLVLNVARSTTTLLFVGGSAGWKINVLP